MIAKHESVLIFKQILQTVTIRNKQRLQRRICVDREKNVWLLYPYNLYDRMIPNFPLYTRGSKIGN